VILRRIKKSDHYLSICTSTFSIIFICNGCRRSCSLRFPPKLGAVQKLALSWLRSLDSIGCFGSSFKLFCYLRSIQLLFLLHLMRSPFEMRSLFHFSQSRFIYDKIYLWPHLKVISLAIRPHFALL